LASTILLNAPCCLAPITNSQLDHGKRSKIKTFVSLIWYASLFLIHTLNLGSQRDRFIMQAVPRVVSSV
jgi:hypothetical protein